MIKAGEFDLSGMLAGIKAEAGARGVKRIVFDSIDVILTLLDDPYAERREIYRLNDWLSESGLTGIITAKSQGDYPFVAARYGFMQFMADCVVVLKLQVVDQIALRYLQVMKYRGSSFAENEAPLVIGASGMAVADISAKTIAVEASPERVSSGVGPLDAMLGGGYYRGSSVLITGSAGTGKSILAGFFAEAACRRKERTFYVSFDENPSEVVRDLSSVGIRLGPHLKSGVLRMHSARAETFSAEVHLMNIKRIVREHQSRCMVVDPAFGHRQSRCGAHRGEGCRAFDLPRQIRRHDAALHQLAARRSTAVGGDARADLDDCGHLDSPHEHQPGWGTESRAQHRQIARYETLKPGARTHPER